MNIKDVAIDRYGAWSKLRLGGLDERLNVIYGVNGSGKTTLVRFLQAMLYGFPHFQESPAPAQSSPWGGSLAIEAPQGRFTLRRHDNGTRTGRLSLHTADGTPIDCDVLPELLSGVDESIFRLVFMSSFRDAPHTDALVQTALAQGFDLTETQPAPPREKDLGLPRVEEDRRLQEEVDRSSAEILRLRDELQKLDDEIAAWEQQHAAKSVVALTLEDDEPEGASLQSRLSAIQSQLERWRVVQQDVLDRRARLRREMMRWADVGADSPVALGEDAGLHLDAIERRLRRLEAEMDVRVESPTDDSLHSREVGRRCGPLVQAVRDEVYRLCRELNRRHLDERRHSVTEELHQLRRCHQEIAAHMERLTRRKERIERELEVCSAALAPTRIRRQETADRLRRCERELMQLHEQRRRQGSAGLPTADQRRSASGNDSPAIQRTPTIMQETGEYLRRLADGRFVALHLWRGDQILWIEDARGELFALETQDRSVRDRVHLALCLALVGAYARRGVRLPLVLDDAFLHLEGTQIDQTAVVLREFAARGHQVLVFTRREQVARSFDRLNAPVFELPFESNQHEQHAVRWSGCATSMADADEAPLSPPSRLDADLPPPVRRDDPPWTGRDDYLRPRRYLHRSDAIHYAPDLGRAAQELAEQGVATVGEFVAVSPYAAQEQLRRLAIPAETVRRWQATARLMCDTPNLRAYDARILAASGVETAEALERLAPEELLGRVERCLATEEGQRLFRMGDDEELARLASWVGSGRATQALRETQKRYTARRGVAEQAA